MDINQLLYAINQLLPPNSALEGDKIGLQIQGNTQNYKKLLVTLEINEEVIEEAVNNSCPCIVTFHPLIYRSLSEINQSERVGSLTYKLIKNDITVISVHTTFDTNPNGNNIFLAKLFQLNNIQYINTLQFDDNYGMGVTGELKEEMKAEDFIKLCSQKLYAPIRSNLAFHSNNNIKNIAIVGGSGSFLLPNIQNLNIDAFITADLTYHYFHSAGNKLLLIDPGHYELEQFIPENLKKYLSNSIYFKEIEIIKSKVYTNPINYFPENNFNSIQSEYTNK